MVIIVMEARAIWTPVSNTINGLTAALSDTLNLSILVRTFLAIQGWAGVHLIGSASLVHMCLLNVLAAVIRSPLALAIHRLTASALGALLELVLVRTLVAIVGRSRAHLVNAAALIVMVNLVMAANSIIVPSSNTVNRLGTFVRGALLKLVSVWASVSIVSRRNRNLVKSASLVLVLFLVMEALLVLIPRTNAVHRLGAATHSALNIAVSVWTGISAVSGWSVDNVSAAPLVCVLVLIVEAVRVRAPHSKAIHWLGAALSGALLVRIGVWASKTIVISNSANGIVSASPVLVVLFIVVAGAILAPVSHAVHRLSATQTLTFHKSIFMWALLTTQISLDIDLEGSASLVLVTILNMVTASIGTPLTLAVDRLAASTLGALLQHIHVWACITIVHSTLQNTVNTAALVLMLVVLIVASIILTPGSNTVHRLRALVHGALLVLVSVRAGVSIVSCKDANLVQSAPLVLVCIHIIVTRSINIPVSFTVNRLRATTQRALHVAVSVRASIPIVGSRSAYSISAALLVLVSVIVVSACIILTPSSQAIHWLGAALSGALLEGVGVWASKTIVGGDGADGIGSASPVLVVLVIVVAHSILFP